MISYWSKGRETMGEAGSEEKSPLGELIEILNQLKEILNLTDEEIEAFFKVLRKAVEVSNIAFDVGGTKVYIRKSWKGFGYYPLILEITHEIEGKSETVQYDLSLLETKKLKLRRTDNR